MKWRLVVSALLLVALVWPVAWLAPIFAAEPLEVQWAKTFGGTYTDSGYSVQQTADGGYIIVGSTSSFGAAWRDVYLIKTDAQGNVSWSKAFGGASYEDAYSVRQTADGGYILTGATTSFGAGGYDVYLIKTDASGNLTWQKTFGGAGDDWGWSVGQTSDSGYIIAGSTNSSSADASDVYLVKTDASGNLTWQKTFGGTSDDRGYSVQQTSDSGYIIVGATASYWAAVKDVYLVKADSVGNLAWSKTFGGAGDDWGYSVQQTTDGGYFIGGSTSSFGAGFRDVYLIKTDASGNLTWQKTFGGAADDWGYLVRQTSDSGYIIVGSTASSGAGEYDVYLVKTDVEGNMSWSQTFGGTSYDWGYSVQQTTDGGYIIGGSTSSFGAGFGDVWLIKVAAGLAGDATGDGKVDARDITKVERIVGGLDPPTPGADANQDSQVNATDITKVEMIIIAGLG